MLAVLASSHLNRPVPARTVLFGEVGLTGEVRAVAQPELRINEAARLGFDRCFLPQGNMKDLKTPKGITLIGVKNVSEVLDGLFD